MCLARVTDQQVNTNIGYKVFEVGDRFGEFKTPVAGKEFQLGVEKRDNSKAIVRIPANRYRRWSEQDYKAGYHIFINLSDAEKYAKRGQLICMVHFNCVSAVGFQGLRVGRRVDNALTVVASRMTIMQVMGQKK